MLPQCSTRFGFFGVLILGLSLLLCGASPALAIDNPPASTTTATPKDATNTPAEGGGGGITASPTPASCINTSGFGYRTHPISGMQKLHAGLDLACPTGTPVYAAMDGCVNVSSISESGGYGNLVTINEQCTGNASGNSSALNGSSTPVNASKNIAETMNWFAANCFSCGIISRLFAASMQYGKVLMPMFGSGIGTFLSVVFVIWVFIQVAKMLLPFTPANRTNAIASTMFTKGALILIVSLILFSPKSYDIYWRYIYKPVVSVSINMSSALLNEGTKGQTGPYVVDTFTLKDGNKCSKTVITGLTSEERALQYRLECMVHTFQNAFSYGLATGWYMITKTGGNANNILIGIIVFVVSITPPITFAVMILDAVIRWVIISCLSPALMGCYCFPATRNYANTGFKGLLEAGLTLSIVSVVAVLSAGVIQEATKTVQASMDKAGSAVAGAASTAATAIKEKVSPSSTPPATKETKLSGYLQQPLSGATTTTSGAGASCALATNYAHLNSVSVTEGMRVTAGTQIGTVGSTGASTGPHLHFEIRTCADPVNPYSGNPVDPAPYLKGLTPGVSTASGGSGVAGASSQGAAMANNQSGSQSGQPLLTFSMAAAWLMIFASMISKFSLQMIPGMVMSLLSSGFGGAMGSVGSTLKAGMGAAMGVAGFGVGAIGQGAFNVLANNEMVAKGLDAIKDGAGAVGGAVGGVVGDIGQRVTEAAMSGINTLRQNNAFVDGALNALAAGGNFVGDIGGRVAATAMSGINAVGDFAKGMQEHLQQKFQDTQQFLQMLEANRIAFMNNMHQAPGEFLKAVNDFLRQNEGISKTFDSIQSLQKGFGDLVDHARAELQRLQNQLATVGNNVYQALPSPVQTGLRVGGDIAQNIGNRAGEFVNNTKERIIDDFKNAPAHYATAAAIHTLSAVSAVPLMAVKAVAGDLIDPVAAAVGGGQEGVRLANEFLSTGSLSRMVDLKHAEATNEVQRQQAIESVDQKIDDMKNTVKQELADLKTREQALRKDTSTPAADIAKELGDISALRQVILRSGQEEITRLTSERDNKINDINRYYNAKKDILEIAQKDYKGEGDLKRSDIRDDYAKKHEELSDRIFLNDERLKDIDRKLRENTAMLATGLPATMTAQIAKITADLSREKTDCTALKSRLNDEKQNLYTQEKLDVQTAIKTTDTATIAERMLNQRAENIIEQQNKAQERATERATAQQAKQEGWNDGVRAQLEKIQADQAAKRASRQPAGFP